VDEPGPTPPDAPREPAGPSATARTVGRYELDREIGRGGMAIVYLARQRDLDRLVALKELSTFHASSPEFAERFLRESRLAGSLSHPNIVTVHEYFEEGGTPYISMEYVSRGSLRPWVGSLSLAQLAGVLEGVLAGLAHAELAGIVHRDLKPENIMVTADGRVKITDFGIAKATQGAGTAAFMTATGMTVGTPTYMAPEQAMAQQIGPWTDLYSVGVIAYEQIAGRAPFHDTEAPMAILLRHVNEPIPPVIEVRPDVDPALSEWVHRLLVKEPAERTRGAVQAWEELEEIVLSLAGPRWRREARLPEQGPTSNTPKPLTPAPFQSQRVKTPAITPAAPASEFVTFNPGAAHGAPPPPPSPPPPPPPPPASEPQAPAPEQPPASTGAESRFITFGPPAETAPPPLQPDPPSPTPAYEPEPEPDAKASEPSPEPKPAAQAPEPEPEPAAQAPEPEPEPEPAAQASAPQPEPAARAYEPEPAAPARARAPEPVPTPGPEPPPTPEPKPAPEAARPSAGGERERTRGRGNRRLVAAAGIATLLAAGVGFAVASASGGSANGTPAPLTGSATAGSLEVSFPSSWQQQTSVPTTPGLQLSSPLAVASSTAGGELVVGSGSPGGPTLLPASLLAALPGAPSGEAVRLGAADFYRYRDLEPSGAVGPETVYALPTTAGTVVGVCVLPSSGASVVGAECERILASLKLTSGSALALGPSQAYAAKLGDALRTLNTARARAGARLAKAGTAAAQATAAASLARAHEQAAAAVRGASPGPAEQASDASVAAALTRIAGGYGAMAGAARGGNRSAFDEGRRTVTRETAALAAALASFRSWAAASGS
jgi:serine/threonine protein kinase